MTLLIPPVELITRVVVVVVAVEDIGDGRDFDGDSRAPIFAPAVPDFNAANCSGLILIILGALLPDAVT